MDPSITSSNHSEALHASFAQVTEFPLEIRQSIWKAALPESRVIMFAMKILHDALCLQVWSDGDVNGSLNDASISTSWYAIARSTQRMRNFKERQ